MKKYRYYLHLLLSLIYPSVCIECHKKTRLGYPLCKQCYSKYSSKRLIKEKKVSINGEFLYDYYYIKKLDENFKSLIHYLKYSNFKILGKVFGKICGIKIKKENINFDYIVPVPLSKNKKKMRGYNQSEIIAKSISRIIKTPVIKGILIKIRDNNSQTKKSKEQRVKNVKGVYNVKNGVIFKDKRILIVDDIHTTGATIQACIEIINFYRPKKVVVITLAKA